METLWDPDLGVLDGYVDSIAEAAQNFKPQCIRVEDSEDVSAETYE
jgi:hypothetical protein